MAAFWRRNGDRVSDNEQQYTPTTAQIEVQFIRGSVTKSATITKAQSEEFGGEFLRWLHQHDAQVREESLNAGVVLAALDGMLEPWTLQKDAEISSMKYRIRRLRDQVAQYVPALPVPSTGAESETPAIDRLLAKHGHAPLAELLAVSDPISLRLAEVQARLNGVDTRLPWESRNEGYKEPWTVCHDSEAVIYLGFDTVAEFMEGDAELIANAPADLSFLLALVEGQREAIEKASALHPQVTIADGPDNAFPACDFCAQEWPCATAKALGVSE